VSKENAKAFLKRLLEDRTLVERCRTLNDQQRSKIAKELGLPHSSADMKAVINEGISQARRLSGALSERELDVVVGGVHLTSIPIEIIEMYIPTQMPSGQMSYVSLD